jgi:hypothetical protein
MCCSISSLGTGVPGEKLPVQLLTVWWICWQDNNVTTWRNGLCKSKLDPRKKKKIELVKDIKLVQL